MTRQTFVFDSMTGQGTLRDFWINGALRVHLLTTNVGQDGADTTMARYRPFILESTDLKAIYLGDDLMDADTVEFVKVKRGSIADALLISADDAPAIFIQQVFNMPMRVLYGIVTVHWDRGPNRVVHANTPWKLTQRLLHPR